MVKAPLDQNIKMMLNYHLEAIERITDSDILAIRSSIFSGLDQRVRDALEAKTVKKDKLTIILDTLGGSAEVVERLVYIIRFHYSHVDFVIPDKAMSAGTIFAMSGDNIYMNYYSVLGPIDPQIQKGDKWVPALSYLRQYETLKSKDSNLTTAEAIILQKFDPGELYQFERARDLSIDLLKKWLSSYKFKDWTETETTKTLVTDRMKEIRAKEIADALSDIDRWHSHGRGIDLVTLNTLKLKVEDYSDNFELSNEVDTYFRLFADYLNQKGWASWIQTKEYF